MPRLVLVAPCENIIVSNENKLSLISIIEQLSFALPPNQVIPPNSVLPMRWFAITIWERQPGDAGKEFESFVEIGQTRSPVAKFRLGTQMHRIVSLLNGFPIVIGDLRLKAYIRTVGQTDFVAATNDYPLSVINMPPGAPN